MSLRFQGIIIENFKSFRGKHEIALERGPALVYVTGSNHVEPDLGANGVGKSTIFDALFWCLFGKTIRDSRPGPSVEPWDSSSAVRVAVHFYNNGQEYRVSRQRNPNGLFLELQDRYKEVTQDTVNKAVGLSEEAFRRTIIMGQFGTLFLDLTPTEQSNLFTEILDLNLWLRASDIASKETKAAEIRATKIKSEVDRISGQSEEAQRNLIQEQEAERNFEEQIMRRLKANRDRLRVLEADFHKVTPPPPQDDNSDVVDTLSANMAREQNAIEALRRSEGDLRKELNARFSAFRSAELSVRADRQTISRYEDCKLTRTCPDCGQTVTEVHLQGKIEAEQGKLERDLETLNNTKAAYDHTVIEVEEVEANLAGHTEKLRRWRGQWENATARRQEAMQLQREYDREVSRLRQDIAGLKAVIAADEERENPHERRIGEIRNHIQQLGLDLASSEAEYQEAKKTADTYKYWITAFKELRLQMVAEVLQELEIAVNRHALNLGLVDWYISFSTSRETKAGNVSLGFTAMIYPPDQVEPIKWESYSGGEAQRWQLAMTFGLAEVLLERAGVTPNIEVLDEPTQHLSQAGIDALLAHLKDRALELGRTIFFVDHRALDRGSFDSQMFVIKDQHGSHLRQTEEV